MNGRHSALLPVDLFARARLVGSLNGAAAVRVAPAPLGPLADSLAADLNAVLGRDLPLPRQKARLTRIGGRCPVHGTLLDFSPWAPNSHNCRRCGVGYVGREHDDWWAMGAQLWTVERAVHGAALFAVRGDPRHARLAVSVLEMLAARYDSWPNRDNVLGPSRPFFSTYLESIWLLNVCHALALLEASDADGVASLGATVRDTLIAPSAQLIAGFHEGTSNRQVWNEVAVLSAQRLLGEDRQLERRLNAPDGLLSIMEQAILPDGSWYEGENYHLFAHRGLWYGVQLMEALGMSVPATLDSRFRAGFLTPFVGLLPDDTFPSRRDSQYAVSMRQWRIAEWCELGVAYAAHDRLRGVLARIYDGRAPLRDTERWCSTADAERNAPPAMLSRSDLSWRGLLAAIADPVMDATSYAMFGESGCLPAQGLAVIRRDASHTYVALEGGHSGGGHGHPDRLALTLQVNGNRWLQDPGTGSYVDASLHWYRSTLAHFAPLVNGRSQPAVRGELIAFDDSGTHGWIWKRAELAAGLLVDRRVVVGDGYLVDLLEWHSVARDGLEEAREADREITLPIAAHADEMDRLSWRPAHPLGAGGLEDGFDFVESAFEAPLPARLALRSIAAHAFAIDNTAFESSADTANDPMPAALWYAASAPGLVVRGTVPGAPGQPPTQRHWLTVRARQGRIAGVWSWPSPRSGSVAVREASFALGTDPGIRVVFANGVREEHRPSEEGWEVVRNGAPGCPPVICRLPVGAPLPAEALIEGRGDRPATVASEPSLVRVPLIPAGSVPPDPGSRIVGATSVTLGERHYVQTELAWTAAGAPSATVQFAATENELIVDIDLRTGPLVRSLTPIENPLDNERADINADGVQWYVAEPSGRDWLAAALVVPAEPGTLRVTELLPRQELAVSGGWRLTPEGWALRLAWQRSQLPIGPAGSLRFDLVINERSPDRERRRGQLVLSGGGGFGYLRGDRHEPARCVALVLDAPDM